MAYDRNNIFAKILRGEVPANKFYEDEEVLAFYDIHPSAPVHVLVIPKGEYESFADFVNNAPPELVVSFFRKVHLMTEKLGIAAEGYRLISNYGDNGGQTIPHFHIHILGKKPLGPLVVGDTHHKV